MPSVRAVQLRAKDDVACFPTADEVGRIPMPSVRAHRGSREAGGGLGFT